jgi:hypothetical protein
MQVAVKQMRFKKGDKVMSYPSSVHKALKKLGKERIISEDEFDYHGTKCVKFEGLKAIYTTDCIEHIKK